MEISELRKTFENQGLETDEINIVVGQVDKRAMRTAQMKEVNANGKNLCGFRQIRGMHQWERNKHQ